MSEQRGYWGRRQRTPGLSRTPLGQRPYCCYLMYLLLNHRRLHLWEVPSRMPPHSWPLLYLQVSIRPLFLFSSLTNSFFPWSIVGWEGAATTHAQNLTELILGVKNRWSQAPIESSLFGFVRLEVSTFLSPPYYITSLILDLVMYFVCRSCICINILCGYK
jgi:hypothetical protein